MSERIAIITGTSSGIGEALAGRLLSENWKVIGIARRAAPLSNPEYQHIKADLGDIESLTGRLIPSLKEILGNSAWQKLGLINNAAITGQLKDLDRANPTVLAESLAINTVAPVALMGMAVSVCQPETTLRVVNISSGLAHFALPGCADYCISKAGLHMASQVFAAEQEHAGMTRRAVMSYSPGTVATQMQQKLRTESEDDFSSVGMFKSFHSAGSLVSPEAVLQPVISFLNDDNAPVFNEVSYKAD